MKFKKLLSVLTSSTVILGMSTTSMLASDLPTKDSETKIESSGQVLDDQTLENLISNGNVEVITTENGDTYYIVDNEPQPKPSKTKAATKGITETLTSSSGSQSTSFTIPTNEKYYKVWVQNNGSENITVSVTSGSKDGLIQVSPFTVSSGSAKTVYGSNSSGATFGYERYINVTSSTSTKLNVTVSTKYASTQAELE